MFNSLPTPSLIFRNQYGDHLPQQFWSKWSGGGFGILKEELDEWYCQVCGEKQVKEFPSYMVSVDKNGREFVRICCLCRVKIKKNEIDLKNKIPLDSPLKKYKKTILFLYPIMLDSIEAIQKRLEMIPEDKSTITISKEIMEKYQVIIELMEQLVEGNIFKKELNSEIRNVIDEILINLPPI